jgi:hypothetical protein
MSKGLGVGWDSEPWCCQKANVVIKKKVNDPLYVKFFGKFKYPRGGLTVIINEPINIETFGTAKTQLPAQRRHGSQLRRATAQGVDAPLR